ncbi:Prolyl oligopeptidase family protein [Planctomycetes bacterium Poly30]|uniref:Prolyl oligopeptidase family protein n=1 Tax=Saltatorellus ferox TaxID=2528018 RepID=A0A518EQR3_9BACT|nr:Prolyl oligopeptidase family protein [Planctomycetes bacterium Poly30]
MPRFHLAGPWLLTSALACAAALAQASAQASAQAGAQVGPLTDADPRQETGSALKSSQVSLLEARRGFVTKLTEEARESQALPVPPEGSDFAIVEYVAPVGKLSAYLCVPRSIPDARVPSEKGRTAIVWITGGYPTARGGAYVFEKGPPENDQSAAPFREAGIVMLFPTVRGTATNPGLQEGMFGEVDDVIAAGEYLRSVPGIDPERVYLGGHSTGGTLVLLVAESTDLFRATFSFGPVGELADYGGRTWTFDAGDEREWRLRSPLHYLGAITAPTYVFEGDGGNIEDLVKLREGNGNPRVRMIDLEGADHFEALTPINRLLAEKIAAGHRGEFFLGAARARAAYAKFASERR